MAVDNLWDILQSSGPISLNELNLRTSESPEELVRKVDELRRKGIIVVTGPHKESLLSLTPEQVAQSSDTVLELSWSGLKSSLS
jgi:predicted transcriptional regulator